MTLRCDPENSIVTAERRSSIDLIQVLAHYVMLNLIMERSKKFLSIDVSSKSLEKTWFFIFK